MNTKACLQELWWRRGGRSLQMGGTQRRSRKSWRAAAFIEWICACHHLVVKERGPRRFRSTFSILAAFRGAGIPVTLGFQSNIGHAAIALGLVDRFSTGVGHRERYWSTRPR